MAKITKTWTSEEVDTLFKYYSTSGDEGVADKLPRKGVELVQKKAREMGLYHRVEWTPRQIREVMQLYKAGKGSVGIAEHMRKKHGILVLPHNIDYQTRKLRQTGAIKQPVKGARRSWTINKREKEYIRKNVGKMRMCAIAANLGFSQNAVRYHAKNMGCNLGRQHRRMSKEEVRYIEKNYLRKAPADIARHLGYTITAITYHIKRLGEKHA